MIDAREHFYDEDPSLGHPEVRTRLGDVSYFFLGNGRITAAVQVCRGDMGTPVGLIVMNTEKPGKKRDSLTLDPESGLDETMIRITMKDTIHQALGKKMNVELPITRQVHAILFQNKDPHEAMKALMTREPKYESLTIAKEQGNT